MLQRRPIISIASASAALKLSKPTVAKSIEVLVKLAILSETTDLPKGRLFTYQQYIQILGTGANRRLAEIFL